MSRRVCIVTGTRAEYGLLRGVIAGVAESADLTLQIVATGMHLSARFGETWRDIEADGWQIDARVPTLSDDDTPAAIADAIGLGVAGIGAAITRLTPDVMVILGDRFEIFAAAVAALVARVPVMHLHGGEISEGAYDDALRHAITKLSHLHCVAAEPYRRRVIQMGESPEQVLVVGGLGVDALSRIAPMARSALEASLGITFGSRNLLVTFHPATLEEETSRRQVDELLAALEPLADTHLIFTLPNADTGGRDIAAALTRFVASRPRAWAFASLGQERYLSCLRHVDAVVGNSSSGLLEAPTVGTPTINIGDRQQGRLKADSVIDCAPVRHDIAAALERVYDPVFRAQLSSVVNPYGAAGASARIVEILRATNLDGVTRKVFHDMTWPHPLEGRG